MAKSSFFMDQLFIQFYILLIFPPEAEKQNETHFQVTLLKAYNMKTIRILLYRVFR